MTSLNMGPEDYEAVVHDHNGRIRLDLTDARAQRLAGAVRQGEAARCAPGNRTQWLRSRPVPEHDVLEEAVSRYGEKLRPALTAMRAAGLIPQAPKQQSAAATGGGE